MVLWTDFFCFVEGGGETGSPIKRYYWLWGVRLVSTSTKKLSLLTIGKSVRILIAAITSGQVF